MSISTEIAHFITKATIDDFSTESIETAKIAFLDCIACLIAGSTDPIAQLLCDQAKHNGGNPHSSVFTTLPELLLIMSLFYLVLVMQP